MKKNNILIGVIVALALGMAFLSFEVVRLRKQVFVFSQLVPASLFNTPGYTYRFPGIFSQRNWQPFEEMRNIQEEMNKMFSNSFRGGWRKYHFGFLDQGSFFKPNIDMEETSDHYIIKVNLPGMEKDNINIAIKGRNLVISGNKSVSVKENKNNLFLRKERFSGNFTRIIALPNDARTNKIDAQYKRGVLMIGIPKIVSGRTNNWGKKIIIK